VFVRSTPVSDALARGADRVEVRDVVVLVADETAEHPAPRQLVAVTPFEQTELGLGPPGPRATGVGEFDDFDAVHIHDGTPRRVCFTVGPNRRLLGHRARE